MAIMNPISSTTAIDSRTNHHPLNRHPLFFRRDDPVTGVPSYILKPVLGPQQQSFYFTNNSISRDGQWLWAYVAAPPGHARWLGAVNLNPDDARSHTLLPAQFDDATPLVCPEGDAAWYCHGPCVYRAELNGDIHEVCRLDADIHTGRGFSQLATHLTLSADGAHLLLDARFHSAWCVALGDLATGNVEVLKWFPRLYNHAQFSPTDPELFMLAQDHFRDPLSGRRFPIDHRIWLMDRAQKRFEPLSPRDWWGSGTRASHEWWSSDGRHVRWIDYDLGVFEHELSTGEVRHVWSTPLCHAHSNATGQLFVADESPYHWTEKPCEVRLFDRTSNREVLVASALPQPPVHRRTWHIDPHPQFSPGGRYIVYTTTLDGAVSIALTPVDEAMRAMGIHGRRPVPREPVS